MTQPCTQIAEAFRERRAITRGTLVCTGDLICCDAHDLMWYDAQGAVWVQAVIYRRDTINDLAQCLGLERPFSYIGGELRFRGDACQPWRSYQLCGPLGMLAIAAERNQQSLQ